MKKYIIANWKMNKTVGDALNYSKSLLKSIKSNKVNIGLCVPYTCLYPISKILANTKIGFGAQNVFFEDKGTFTGEISALMLKDVGCAYCIIGHSERRSIFNESDDLINHKLKALISHRIIPILCLGETSEQRKRHLTFRIIEKQLRAAVNGITDLKDIIIAYEPLWAIGTGVNATPEQAEEVHKFIRTLISALYNNEIANKIPILYGGSVNLGNIKSLMDKDEIDGALVGGASLDVTIFSEMANCIK